MQSHLSIHKYWRARTVSNAVHVPSAWTITKPASCPQSSMLRINSNHFLNNINQYIFVMEKRCNSFATGTFTYYSDELRLQRVKKKGKAVPLHAMEAQGERRYSSYSFYTSTLDGGEWSASRPGRAFTPGESTPGTHCTGGWVGPRAGLDTEDRGKILCPRRGSNPDRPVVQPVVRHYTAWATRLKLDIRKEGRNAF
jgi:hypothetical protein